MDSPDFYIGPGRYLINPGLPESPDDFSASPNPKNPRSAIFSPKKNPKVQTREEHGIPPDIIQRERALSRLQFHRAPHPPPTMAPILTSNPALTLVPEPLTPANFAQFGTAIQSPLPRDLNVAAQPSSLPPNPHTPTPILANQNSALKYSPISPMLDTYKSGPSGTPSATRMTMFCCFPRKLRSITANNQPEKEAFDVRILERHPYTNQTFIPTDLSSHSKVGNGEEEPIFLVVVAPTLKGETATAKNEAGELVTIRDPPDLRNVKAFIAHGGQSVTYGVGTWHAPMVVLGSRRVDFVVVQHVNGVDDEDCQEAAFGEGVVVDLGRRGQYGRKELGAPKLWTAKL